jgi:hypothetical protein
VAEQHKLFSLLPPGICGITLSDSALMHPIKSVSGITGIGKHCKQKGISAIGAPIANVLSEKSSAGKIQKKIFEQLEISKGYYLFAVGIANISNIRTNNKYK